MEGFDFAITTEGELIIDEENHDIVKSLDDDLRIQLAYNRIKSISKNWFVDEVGADMEELIGRPCTEDMAEYGKQKIINVLLIDNLWNKDDIFIKAEIKDNVHIIYSVYLKLFQSETEDTISYEITVELDLVKGVFIKFGWDPRR
ncbi:MAG: hypothetical protein SPJ62_13980 [Inconstantimicrobium porci]|uniref:hypothetical protein n=1 Tax=Inconstantimicrobium porci TaxID=2652291 RepID=UPI002A91F2D7|nr:hypothetical protein [Inconstantimicrobium porci]MDY5913079.1 hypothetical protein [Inconstantimicrobium porci]